MVEQLTPGQFAEYKMRKLPKVVIPNEHLNPSIRYAINEFNIIPWARKIAGAITVATIPIIASTYEDAPVNVAAFTAYQLFVKYKLTESFERIMSKIKTRANKYGLLDTRFESLYPNNWMNPIEVAKTHPIFYIDLKGNLVILQNTRMEYYRYAYQKTFPGRFGFQPWLWRSYFEPPVAPESIRQWAKEKLLRLVKKEQLGHAQRAVEAPQLAYESIKPKEHVRLK